MPDYYGPYHDPSLYAWQHYQQLADLPFYLRLADEAGGGVGSGGAEGSARNARPRILELGCGTGRLSIPLAEAGFPVTGVDNNPAMLAWAERKRGRLPQPLQNRLEFRQADAASLHLCGRWDLILFPYHSVGHIPPGAGLQGLADGLAAHLQPGGRCVLSLLQPDAELCNPAGSALHVLEEFAGSDGNPVTCYESSRYFPASRTLRFDWYYEFATAEELLHIVSTVYVHSGDEVAACCARAGLRLCASYGDFDASPWHDGSPELLQVYE